MKKIGQKISEKVFHSMNEIGRPLKPLMVKIGLDYRTQKEKECKFFPFDDIYQVHDRGFFDYFHKNHPGFTEEEFTENRDKIIYDTRFCFGYDYVFYEDDIEKFVKIYNSDEKSDTCYDMFFEELCLIDVAAWFGAEKIYFYLKNCCNKELSCPHLSIYGGNEKIINDCLVSYKMNAYQRSRFVKTLLLDRHFDLALKICEKNEVKDIKIYSYMFVPLDVINKIKGVKVSGSYCSDDNLYLVDYWYTFIEDNGLDAEFPDGKWKMIKASNSANSEDNIPKQLII